MDVEFRTKYDESESIRKGIANILSSDHYSEEYKDLIRRYLGFDPLGMDILTDVDDDIKIVVKDTENIIETDSDNTFVEKQKITISKSELTESDGFIVSTRIGGTHGYIEKPKYIDGELVKAVDVLVDELIVKPKKQKPETVSKLTFDEKVIELFETINEFTSLTELYNSILSEIEEKKLEINSLEQGIDAGKLLTATAENETEVSNERYQAVLVDFQNALTKGIQEAIERVSLEAQVRGLQAQKELLKQQLDGLEIVIKNLQTQTEILQQQLTDQQANFQALLAAQAEQFGFTQESLLSQQENLQSLLEQQQLQFQQAQEGFEEAQDEAEEAAASAIIISGPPRSFGQTANTGWKIPTNNIKKIEDISNGFQLKFESYRYSNVWPNGNTIEFYNLKSDTPVTFRFRYSVLRGGHSSTWIGGPSSVTVPPRSGNIAGKVIVNFRKIRKVSSPAGRGLNFDDKIAIQTSVGDTYALSARMWRKLRSGGSGN